MNRYEKIAWFNLTVLSVSFVLYFIMFLLLRMKFDFFLSAQIAASAFAVVAVCSFGPLMFSKKKRDSVVLIDERGKMIRQKKSLYRYVLFWAVYISIFIGAWIWMKFTGTISDEVNVLLVFLIVSVFALFIFTLYLYFKRQKESDLVADEQNVFDVVLYGPDMDERDLMIQKSARWCGFGIFWFFYVFGIMGTWGWLKYSGYHSISVDFSVLPHGVFGAFILIFTVDSITRVFLYRWGK